MALFQKLGKIGFSVLIFSLFLFQALASSQSSAEIIIFQRNQFGFQSSDTIKKIDQTIFYNNKKVKIQKAYTLFNEMLQVKFNSLEVSCPAGTIEAEIKTKTTRRISGCLVGEKEKAFIAKLQEIRFLKLKGSAEK